MWLEKKQLEKKNYYLEKRPTKIVNMQGLLNLFYPSSLFKEMLNFKVCWEKHTRPSCFLFIFVGGKNKDLPFLVAWMKLTVWHGQGLHDCCCHGKRSRFLYLQTWLGFVYHLKLKCKQNNSILTSRETRNSKTYFFLIL